MKWLTLDKNEAMEIMIKWTDLPESRHEEGYEGIRYDLLAIYSETKDEMDLEDEKVGNSGYEFDLRFGLRLYELLREKYGMDMRTATEDGVWRYLSVCTVPDVVYYRWGLKPSRFWKESRRIWLKTMWWYVHLSYQGSIPETNNILRDNTTDEVVQLVERSGSDGYRINLYREIIRQYGEMDTERKKRSAGLFRRVMKLNTARCKLIEPDLADGGLKGYVKELFDYFESKDK